MQLRVVSLTLALAGTAVLIIGLIISYTVAANLFQSQLTQVLTLSAQATNTASAILQSSDASDASTVQRLRAKVEHDPDNPRIVMTVRGVGYRAGATV